MYRFVVYVLACSGSVVVAGALLWSSIQSAGAPASDSSDRPSRESGILEGIPSGPTDPRDNLEEKLQSIVAQRNNEVAEAKLDLIGAASELQLSIDVVAGIQNAWQIEFEVWQGLDHGMIGAIGGQPIPAPQYPTGEIMRAVNEARQVNRAYRTARERYDVRVDQVRRRFYQEYVDLFGHERASEMPPEPVLELDATLEQAELISSRFEEHLQAATN